MRKELQCLPSPKSCRWYEVSPPNMTHLGLTAHQKPSVAIEGFQIRRAKMVRFFQSRPKLTGREFAICQRILMILIKGKKEYNLRPINPWTVEIPTKQKLVKYDRSCACHVAGSPTRCFISTLPIFRWRYFTRE